MRERQLRPYTNDPKGRCRRSNLYGVDHETYCGATPLMLAARAGNVALIEALLARGADPELVDDFRADRMDGRAESRHRRRGLRAPHLAALFERLGPETLDVHADGRLVRLERGQGEFWPLGSCWPASRPIAVQPDRQAARTLTQYTEASSPTASSRRSTVFRSIFGRKHAARRSI